MLMLEAGNIKQSLLQILDSVGTIPVKVDNE